MLELLYACLFLVMEMDNKTVTEQTLVTTANFVKCHLLDRVRHLAKSEPSLVKPLSTVDNGGVINKLTTSDKVKYN